jgi:acetylornithine/N-succinyldiaminopimelate aminotransferase
MHGTTFGSNPVVCAGALEVLDRVTKPEFLSEVTAKGEYIKSKVADMKSPIVKDIRGLGMMIGVQIEGTPKDYALSALEKGLLILTAGTDVLRFLPPLNTDMKIIDRGLEILSEILL